MRVYEERSKNVVDIRIKRKFHFNVDLLLGALFASHINEISRKAKFLFLSVSASAFKYE